MTKKDTYVYDHNNNYYCHRHDPSPYTKTGLFLILFLLSSQLSFAQSVSGPVQPIIPCTSGNTSTCGSAMSVTTSGNVTVVQPTGSNLHTVCDSGCGTVTANAGTNLNTSLLQLDTTGAKLNISQGAALGTNTGPMPQCSVTAVSSPPAYTTGTINPLNCNTNGALSVGSRNLSVSGTITSTTCPGTGCVSLAIEGSAGVGFHIQGTWTATLIAEGSYDGGTTWFTTDVHNELSGSEVVQSVPTTNGPYHYMLSTGFTHVRIRASAYTSGTVSVVIVGNDVPHTFTDYQQSEGNPTPSMRVFIGGTDGTNMRGIGVLNSSPAGTEYGAVVRNLPKPSTLSVNATALTGVAVTATLPAVASQYHYITLIEISHTTSAALTAGTTPVLCTTTNFTAANTFPFDAAADAQGTQAEKLISPMLPIRSSAVNTATTIVCPATTGVIWTINVYYYAAP